MPDNKYWGYHAQYECAGCPKELIASKENIVSFTKELIEKIDMIGYGEPIIEHFATHDPTKGGYTMLALIETSNLSAHFVEERGEAYIDCFSCKVVDVDVARKVIQDFFSPKAMTERLILRSAPSI
jgi:S-adenosylmethionine/arginine decarboxylase-like enzyme